MKILRIHNSITVIFEDNSMLSSQNCNDKMYNEILSLQDNEEEVKKILAPQLFKKIEEYKDTKELLDNFNNSKYLTTFGNSVYIKSVCELSVPQDLAICLYKAEKENNQDLIDTYLNFWTLCSLNPDSRARINLFWFLNKYGMTISKSGLFIAYRNVNLKKEGSIINTSLAKFISEEYFRVKTKLKKSPKNYFIGKDSEGVLFIYKEFEKVKDKSSSKLGNLFEEYNKLSNEDIAPVYTDSHSGTFTIKIGEVVSMPREECDSIQENTCSKGLHVAGKDWLSQGYYGQISLMVLVNPADVVAVPPSDSYGKMRVCAYYPVQLIERDKEGNIINQEINDGFEDDFIDKILVSGGINNEDISKYTILIPNIPEINKENIYDRLSEISKNLKKYIE